MATETKPKLTEREFSMLSAIVTFCAENGFSPTVRELMELEGLSRGTTHRTLVGLREKGKITWVEGSKGRTIRKAKL